MVRIENLKAWRELPKKIRDEIRNVLGICADSSEMSDPEHPDHAQYQAALDLADKILDYDE